MQNNVGGHNIEIITSDNKEDLKKQINEFLKPKLESNVVNARAGGTVPLLYDIKILDTKIIQDKDGNVQYIVVIRY